MCGEGRGAQGRGRSSPAFLQPFCKVRLMLSSRDGKQSTRQGARSKLLRISPCHRVPGVLGTKPPAPEQCLVPIDVEGAPSGAKISACGWMEKG